jgi:hypothetical protein
MAFLFLELKGSQYEVLALWRFWAQVIYTDHHK